MNAKIVRYEDVYFLENPLCVISVAVNGALV